MSFHITIVSWNMNGISFLKSEPEKRGHLKALITRQLNDFIHKHRPDLIAIQEIVRYEENGAVQELVDPPDGYFYQSSISIDTARQNNPVKWEPIRKSGKWSSDAYLGQGNGLMWRSDIPHCSIWDWKGEKAQCGGRLRQEVIRIDTGLFIGTRDTEPRIAVVSHFIWGIRHIFVANLHLTTLSREREGFPDRDCLGAEIRGQQLNIVLNGIVSRYNHWCEKDNPIPSDDRPVWFLAGDFNATEDSLEIAKIKRLNFLDLCPDKGTGTKRGKRGQKAVLTLDYIFAGPAYYAFDPQTVKQLLEETSQPPLYDITVSDHYPIIAKFPVLEDIDHHHKC
ncbi:MAG: endonuclease/exonuclease/phosphatase family protein [Deltaproteobacteria bacterium]|nr:endonuclease/exonuclease/phosphatase family protein [Deltaproteobacteria bacterium]